MNEASVWLFWLLAGGALISLVVLGSLQGLAAAMLWRRVHQSSADRPLPPISVLKPLKGVDAALRTNLEAFLAQDYPTYELLFGVEDPTDPVIPIVRRFMTDHPEAPIRLVLGANQTGMNPKVNNLTNIARYARYDHLLISDADVRPGPEYLRTIASDLDDGVGLVHNVLVGVGERRLGSILESLHMNSFFAATLCGAHVVRHSCVVGKSMLFSKSELESLGGFKSVENVLAEDYVLGQRFQRSGRLVKLSMYPLRAVNPGRNLKGFVNRQLRWAQMRRHVCLRAYLAELFGNPNAWLFLWLPVAFLTGERWAPQGTLVALAALFLASKCVGDVLLSRGLRGDFKAVRYLPLIPLKDLLIAFVWALGLFKRRINWRGHSMIIGKESRLFPDPREFEPMAQTGRA